MAPSIRPEQAIAALKAQGAPDEAIHAYLEQRYGPATPAASSGPAPLSPQVRARRAANRADLNAADQEGVDTGFMGLRGMLARNLPNVTEKALAVGSLP